MSADMEGKLGYELGYDSLGTYWRCLECDRKSYLSENATQSYYCGYCDKVHGEEVPPSPPPPR